MTINVLANDSDPDGDAIHIVGFADPEKGSVTLNGDNSFTYTPRPGFVGSESFEYTISDTKNATSTAVVTVTVNDVASSSAVYVADLDGSVGTRRNQWRASVAALVVDGNNRPVSGATVSGSWSDGRTASGKTNTRGSVTFSVLRGF